MVYSIIRSDAGLQWWRAGGVGSESTKEEFERSGHCRFAKAQHANRNSLNESVIKGPVAA